MSDDHPSPRPLQYHLNKARDDVSEQLQQAYVDGYMTEDELDERLDMAESADSVDELEPLIADLPVESDQLIRRPDDSLRSQSAQAPAPKRPRRDSLSAIFSGIDRSGPWTVPEILDIQAIFGGIDLDFSDTDLPPGKTTIIRLSVIFGGVDITLPPNVRVEINADCIFGGIDHQSGSTDERAHTIRLEGILLFGGVDIGD